MKKVNLIIYLLLTGIISTLSLTSCVKKGCTDPSADNFSVDVKKDDGTCTYPKINFNQTTNDGDVTGGGGDATATIDWENNLTTAELNMDITAASGGSLQITVKDADGAIVINETLTVGVGDDSRTVCSSSGTPGTWTITVTVTDFSGDGSYSLSQGC